MQHEHPSPYIESVVAVVSKQKRMVDSSPFDTESQCGDRTQKATHVNSCTVNAMNAESRAVNATLLYQTHQRTFSLVKTNGLFGSKHAANNFICKLHWAITTRYDRRPPYQCRKRDKVV